MLLMLCESECVGGEKRASAQKSRTSRQGSDEVGDQEIYDRWNILEYKQKRVGVRAEQRVDSGYLGSPLWSCSPGFCL